MRQYTLIPDPAPAVKCRIYVHARGSVDFILNSCRRRGVAARVTHTTLFAVEIECSAEELEEIRNEFNTRPRGTR